MRINTVQMQLLKFILGDPKADQADPRGFSGAFVDRVDNTVVDQGFYVAIAIGFEEFMRGSEWIWTFALLPNIRFFQTSPD